jgi:DNA-binding transcriptional MerR regulator
MRTLWLLAAAKGESAQSATEDVDSPLGGGRSTGIEMKNQLYTVKQLARLAGVGIKTLHHYDAIGLLPPHDHSAAGYRLYARGELERLQQILFYRELGFSLKTIHQLMTRGSDRLSLLREQHVLVRQRQDEFTRLLAALERTIASTEQGEDMPDHTLFEGFKTSDAWAEALEEHNTHLKVEYGIEPAPVADPVAMNELAAEAADFSRAMADSLRRGVRPDMETVSARIRQHLDFLTAHGHPTTAEAFVLQCEFFAQDAFHYNMLESQQVGLACYMIVAGRALART